MFNLRESPLAINVLFMHVYVCALHLIYLMRDEVEKMEEDRD